MNELDDRPARPRRTRADALRNREQILRAAVDLIIEEGPAAPMELIARRANVGIATLYRHFPDRSVLLRQVALDTLRQSAEEATAALAEEQDAFTALARFMHDAIDLRIGAVMPVLAERITMDDELMEARRLSREAQNALASAAHEEGSLRPDVTAGDISLLIIRLTPPLPGTMPAEDNHRLSHRHLELLLDGLLRLSHDDGLPGPAMSINELTQIQPGPGTGHAGISAEIRAKERSRCWHAHGTDRH
ncbi:MAG: TetR family transcriptional regulator [Actinophytocola sp.]|uniref:TetR/AcrR family transcriptional regulator n=1 Tax=Actinophytocola sp. TaxID=1872138 RepID=UPI0013243C8D|nr:TetR/AcrR family transcriptional regulator [Actinophytocola sp.]MPZ85156.1 TetR family transcriptional regulator [Actinophytocola sp.]